MLQGCVFETSMLGSAMVKEINEKVERFSKKIGSIGEIEPENVLSYLNAASEIYPIAVKLRERAETDEVYGVEDMIKELYNILRKLIKETGSPEDEFGSLEIPSLCSLLKDCPKPDIPMDSEEWLEDTV